MESRYVGQDVSEMSLEDLGDRLRLDSKTQEHRDADSCSSRPSKRNDAARSNGMMPPTITR
jgi:hypothetical protein